MRQQFMLRPHDAPLAWRSNHSMYCRFALDLLPQLERQNEEVRQAWPVAHDQPLRDVHINYPDFAELLDERHRTSDSIRVYAAMAVEGFLNWYGVLRLGSDVFNAQFERLGLVPKLQSLLLVCDSLVIGKRDPLVQAIESVASIRNALVHPKAKELTPDEVFSPPSGGFVDSPRRAVTSMQQFFEAFAEAVPEIEPFVPRG